MVLITSHSVRHGAHWSKPVTLTVPAAINRSCRVNRSTLGTTIQTGQNGQAPNTSPAIARPTASDVDPPAAWFNQHRHRIVSGGRPPNLSLIASAINIGNDPP